jgi:hypothetical protein
LILRIRKNPLFFMDEEEAHLKKMLDAGVIQHSISEWASALVLIRKDMNVRCCLDYRRLNNVTRKDDFPLPLIDECMDTLTGNVWFLKLDANSTFNQIKISPEDRKKTASSLVMACTGLCSWNLDYAMPPPPFTSHEPGVPRTDLEYFAGILR